MYYRTIMQTSPTSTRGRHRRRLILETTLRLIAEGGVDSVTHRRVADAAGIPLGSTTYYFRSREHLLRETFDHYLEHASRLQRTVRTGPINSVTAMVDYLVELTQLEFEDEGLLLAEYELTLFAARDAHVAASLHRWDAMIVQDICAVLENMGAANPMDAAQTILNLMRGYELDRLTRHGLDSINFRQRLLSVMGALLDA